MAKKSIVVGENDTIVSAVGTSVHAAEKRESRKKIRILTISGKRKTSIAKATIREGKGMIRINKMPLETYPFLRKIYLSEPLRIAEEVIGDKLKTVNIDVNVKGGGNESQTEASRLAIARVLVEYLGGAELKAAFLKYDRSLLVADVRRKEMRKPGDSKARARRQTSYR